MPATPLLHTLLFDPRLLTPLACFLALFPLMRLYRRVGLSPFYGLLVFASLLVPFAGFVATFLPLALLRWPRFPAPQKAADKVAP